MAIDAGTSTDKRIQSVKSCKRFLQFKSYLEQLRAVATALWLLKCLPNTFLRIDARHCQAGSVPCVCRLFKGGGVFKHSAYYLLAKHPPRTEEQGQEITAPYNTASNNRQSQWKLRLSLFLLFLLLLYTAAVAHAV